MTPWAHSCAWRRPPCDRGVIGACRRRRSRLVCARIARSGPVIARVRKPPALSDRSATALPRLCGRDDERGADVRTRLEGSKSHDRGYASPGCRPWPCSPSSPSDAPGLRSYNGCVADNYRLRRPTRPAAGVVHGTIPYFGPALMASDPSAWPRADAASIPRSRRWSGLRPQWPSCSSPRTRPRVPARSRRPVPRYEFRNAHLPA